MLQSFGRLESGFDHHLSAGKREPVIHGKWIVCALLASIVVVGSLMMRDHLMIASSRPAFAAVFLSLIGLALARVVARRPANRFQHAARDLAENIFLFVATTLLGVIASYPVAVATSGFADASLQKIDLALHFNWVEWYLTVSRHPSLQVIGSAAYASIYLSPVLIVTAMACLGQRCEARQFLAAFWLAEVMTLALFMAFPAVGPLAFLWHQPIPYMPTSALYQEQLIPALRAHRLTHVDLGALRGLVCAPSFHTTAAMLYMLAAWPIRQLRWPIIAINVVMLLAVPVEGTHYLSDMIGGAIVAMIAWAAIRLLAWSLLRRNQVVLLRS